jgi:two-component system, OmpR family, heavy metal sensor histidine kinase CusS
MVRRLSLSARLAWMFAGVTTLVFSIAGVHLYHSLNDQLQRHEDIALLGTLEIMRHQLMREGGMEAMHGVINLLHAAYGPRSVILAIRDRSGAVVAASTAHADTLPTDRPLPLDAAPDLSDIRTWYEGNQKRGRIIVARERTNDPAMPIVLLTIAREDSMSGVVLDAHAQEVLITLFAGVIATGVLGYAVSRRALRPVKALARRAGDITGSHLDQRLDPERSPRELRDMVAAFNLMLDRLQESFKRLNRFSSDIAHDLQTPLSNLMGGTQVALSKKRSPEEYETLLASNVEEFERLSWMIKDMLFLAKADNPETLIERKPVDLRKELEKVVEYYDTLREDARPPVRVEGVGWVIGDQLLIQRAIQNLVSNALRHSHGGPVATIIAAPVTGFVDLIVSNAGPGIAPEHQPYVFDRFYRADAARTRSSEGSGLGLAIVKSIAEMHGGEVSVSSTPNVVTRFTLRLPACTVPHAATASAA